MIHRKSVMPAAVSTHSALGFSKSVARERECADSAKCEYVSFHICFHLSEFPVSSFVTGRSGNWLQILKFRLELAAAEASNPKPQAPGKFQVQIRNSHNQLLGV